MVKAIISLNMPLAVLFKILSATVAGKSCQIVPVN